MNTAEALTRLQRLYHQPKWAGIVEFEGIDFLAIGSWRSTQLAMHGFEIKVSRSDWLRELKHGPQKSVGGRRRCDYWWLAAPDGVLRDGELPAGWGFLLLTARGTRVVTKPKRLRPKPEGGVQRFDDGTFCTNEELHRAETVAMLARRYAYAQADADALRAALEELAPDAVTAALDEAAVATGRWTSGERDAQRKFAAHQRERTRSVKVHRAHTEAGAAADVDCPYCQANPYLLSFYGERLIEVWIGMLRGDAVLPLEATG